MYIKSNHSVNVISWRVKIKFFKSHRTKTKPKKQTKTEATHENF